MGTDELIMPTSRPGLPETGPEAAALAGKLSAHCAALADHAAEGASAREEPEQLAIFMEAIGRFISLGDMDLI